MVLCGAHEYTECQSDWGIWSEIVSICPFKYPSESIKPFVSVLFDSSSLTKSMTSFSDYCKHCMTNTNKIKQNTSRLTLSPLISFHCEPKMKNEFELFLFVLKIPILCWNSQFNFDFYGTKVKELNSKM